MDKTESATPQFSLDVGAVKGLCPAGEAWAERNNAEGAVPVFSCEGACIRGEIARVAANVVAEEDGYARACHAETFTVPYSAMNKWVTSAERVVMIDGCFLKCHGRILSGLVDNNKIEHFDAHAHYKKYTDLFEIDSVPRNEIEETARDVATWVIDSLAGGKEGRQLRS